MRLDEVLPGQGELQLNVKLTRGLGVSIVSRKPPEELLYIHLKGINLHVTRTPVQTVFQCNIEDLQADNQLIEPECPVVLYVVQPYRDEERAMSAVTIVAHKQHSLNTNAHIFKVVFLGIFFDLLSLRCRA